MIQTINPSFNDKSKTAEIMARYRPIAPKPDSPLADADSAAGSSSSLPPGIRKSPYLVSVWNQLQARPTRTRKRGRTALGPLVSVYKRSRFASNAQTHYYTTPMAAHSGNLSFVPTAVRNGYPPDRLVPNLHPMKIHPLPVPAHSNAVSVPAVPMEVDFMHQLEKPNNNNNKVAVPVTVISPRAIRPVGSIITVGMISPAKKGPGKRPLVTFCKRILLKKADVERDVELEALPAVVSDSEHRVRLTNAAYNEMVGQPECPWLDFGVGRHAGGAGACRRIGGGVVLKLANEAKVGVAEGFSCYVRIEWGKKDGGGEIKHVVNAYCEAVRLACDSDDYFLQWRFHVKETSESGSNARICVQGKADVVSCLM